MKKQGCLWSLVLILVIVMSLAITAFADETPNGWHQNSYGEWFYFQNGEAVTDTVLNLGGVYYAFGYDGIMLDNCECWIDDGWYRARPGGALYVNSWYQDSWGSWYYYGANGKAADDFTLINGVWYFFYGDGSMVTDSWVYSDDYAAPYIISKDGTGSVRIGEGWNQAFGEWYYVERIGSDLVPLAGDFYTINGVTYYFDYNGQMAANEVIWYYDEEQDIDYHLIAGPSGAIVENGWVQLGNKWAYVSDFERIEEGAYEIGGNLYIFENGYMYDLPGEYHPNDISTCYVSASGALYRNQWYYDTTCDSMQVGWRYFGDDGTMVRNQFMTIGGVKYRFDSSGKMYTNTVMEIDGTAYLIDGNGAWTEANGWFRHPLEGEWMYAVDGTLADGLMTIGGATYAFDSGRMEYSGCYYGYNEGMYLVDANGHVIKTPGWTQMNSRWYYITDTTGELAAGFMEIGGSLYYLDPAMYRNVVFSAGYDDGEAYFVADNAGRCTKLTGTGFVSLTNGNYWSWTGYVENGVPVMDAWREINGDKYYFDDWGEMVAGVYYIDDITYLFDYSGKLMTSGWLHSNSGSVFYAQADGTATTGKATIDGKEYLFHEDGRLYGGGMREFEGVTYYLSDNGQILEDFSQDGWHQAGTDRYYVKDGVMLTGCLKEIDGYTYGFTNEGKMCHSGIMYAWGDYYIFDENGHILTGWQQIDGKWYYAADDEDPQIVENGFRVINGNEYFFKDGALVIGTYISTYDFYGIITTDANGVIIDYADIPDGWIYTSEGDVIYNPADGSYYNGWLGNYFISYGHMVFNDIVEYNGKMYYLGAQGLLVRNAWIEHYEPYYTGKLTYRAKADGSLYCNEWYYSGGVYYYFDYGVMVHSYDWYIDGKWHSFDENGKWLGESVSYRNTNFTYGLSDGWHYMNGGWYFYHAGAPLFNGAYYINGAYYAFDYDGKMVTNAAYEKYYYTAGGNRLNATGWQLLGGQWYYFGADHTVQTGWVWADNAWYYIDSYYVGDYYSDKYACRMLANEYYIEIGWEYGEPRLYYFNASGATNGPVTADGWYQTDRGWHYIVDGALVKNGYHKIGGVGYYFENGIMVANSVIHTYDYTDDYRMPGYRYFNASGAEVTAVGWYMVNGKWIYVTTGGQVLHDGIYNIGGTYYSFSGAYWVG